jgi:uncharacterized membrane protein
MLLKFIRLKMEGSKQSKKEQPRNLDDDFLKIRYAKGEIIKEQYNEIKSVFE